MSLEYFHVDVFSLSVGCEDTQDLLDDITQAFAAVSTAEANHP